MFDLEKAIQQWLKQFSRQRAFDDGTIREMELHLRDHIEDLTSEGMDARKAFNQAVDEFGEVSVVAKAEFRNQAPRRTNVYVGMYKNFLRIGIRSLTKQPFFTFLNTFGLAVGMAGCILISLFIYDELSFDTMFAEADRIYRINVENQTNGEYSSYAAAPGPMAGVLVQDCPQVESVMRFRSVGSTLVKKPEDGLNVKVPNVIAADTALFSMFGLRLIEGNAKSALAEPNKLVMTAASAKNHFGTEKALGKTLLLNNKDLYVVSGILEDPPANSFLRNSTIFLSLSSFKDAETTAWNTWYFPTFVKLKPNTKVDDLQAFLDTVKDRYLIPWAMTFIPGLTVENSKAADKASGDFMRFNSIKLSDIHLYSANRRGEISPNSDIDSIYIMMVIGIVLMTLAVVNFMNLSTAHSLRRSKEVGIRKTLGSSRAGVIRQFLTESGIITSLSLILGLMLAAVALPFFNVLAEKTMTIPFDSIFFWICLGLAAIIIGILAGGYPAIFMSRFIPAQVLKGSNQQVGGNRVRNGLVIFQFAISVFLIVSSIVIYQQVDYIRNKDLGFRKDQILVINDVQTAGNQLQSLKEQINGLSQVESVSLSSYLPTPSSRSRITYFLESAFDNNSFNSENAMIIEQWDVDFDYVNTLGLEVIAGRNFDRQHGSDSTAILINESVLAMLGVTAEEIIGQRLTTDFHRADKENMEYLTVIGVIKNFHFESLRNTIYALTLKLGGKPERMLVRMNNEDYKGTIGDIKKVWSQLTSDQQFSYYFMDESFNDTYKAELRLGTIFITFTMLSIFIACLGLFGLAAFNAEKRTKEIGIKKVLGASVKQIAVQLSLNFLKLVLWSAVIAIPLSFYAMNKWLQAFTYRTEIQWWIFVLAAVLAMFISLATVCYQSIKAAIVNPVKSLRSE